METRKVARLVLIRPQKDFGSPASLQSLVGDAFDKSFSLRLFDLPLVAIVVDPEGLPMLQPSLFLADTAFRSRSTTGDTVRTYGEALLPWLNYLANHRVALSDATEETIGVYRAKTSHGLKSDSGKQYASATVNQRVIVPIIFHSWGQRSGAMPSPLGAYLQEGRERQLSRFARKQNVSPIRRLSPDFRAPRVISRLPTALTLGQIQGILNFTPMPYRLMLKWCVTTGVRRFEVCNLKLGDLPNSEQVGQSSDGMLRLTMLRKGGREVTVHVPAFLIEETHWYVLTERPHTLDNGNPFVFVNKRGEKISPQALTKAFRASADAIKCPATLHHLRHTFAVHALGLLERRQQEGDAMNSLKTLQVLLGHASIESTEIYLQAVQTSSDTVMDVLNYLYGATL